MDIIRTDKLKIGDVFKNYKELSETLNIQYKKGGCSQKSQIKELKRYFDFERDGQKYIITDIYTTPLPRDDKRLLGNNSEYRECIEMILLDYLSKQEGKSTNITLKNLFLLLGMANQNYMNKDYVIKDDEISEWQIQHFNQRSYNKLYSILITSLNNLRNRRLIDYHKTTMINVQIEDRGYIYNETRTATKQEEDNIRETEREVLKQMGLESMVLVFLKFKSEEFYKRVGAILFDRYKINYYYNTIEIRFTHHHIEEAKETQAERILLNEKVINSLNKEAETKVLNSKTLENNLTFFNEEHEQAYLISQKKLAEYLIEI